MLWNFCSIFWLFDKRRFPLKLDRNAMRETIKLQYGSLPGEASEW